MNTLLTTAWVKPPQLTTGLDHLGVQAPCIQIYGQLLPGITNVTDRARYYSFYPWLFNELEKRGLRAKSEVIEWLRKAECLFTMVAIRHSQKKGGYAEHAGAVVGSNTLSQVVTDMNESSSVRLSDYAHQNDQDRTRYFKNSYGGLGQYYFGVLEELKIMLGSSVSEARLSKPAGVKVAQGMSQGIPGEAFLNILERDSLTLDDLDDLAGFCHCQLKHSAVEKNLLIDMLRAGWMSLAGDNSVMGAEEQTATQVRARSLGLLMFLSDLCAGTGLAFDVRGFRAVVYTHTDPQGGVISWPESLLPAAELWQVYQRNELLSLAMQGLFFAVLKFAETESVRFVNSLALADAFWSSGPGDKVLRGADAKSVQSELEHRALSLAKFGDWRNPRHEVQLSERVIELTHAKAVTSELLAEVTDICLDILGAVCCRKENQSTYGPVQFRTGYLEPYPVNLESVNNAVHQRLNGKPLSEGLMKFTLAYCLESHMRVAMRKLRQQLQDTFRFEISETGLIVKNVPPASHTSPRFNQAIRILLDLGLLESKDSLLCSTSSGKAFLADIK